MAELRVRNIDSNILQALDSIVEKEKYSSRNQLVNEILSHYVNCKSDLFNKSLSPTIKALCIEELKNHHQKSDQILDNVMPMFIKILSDLDDLRSIFYDNLP